MDEEQEEEGVLSILEGREGWGEVYSSISEFKHHLKDSDLVNERQGLGCVLWRPNEQQLNDKITNFFKHLPSTTMCNYMAQFWGVVKLEGRPHHLSTSHHPFFVGRLRKGYCWYRNICRDHVYRVEEEDGQLGGVGRAYRSKNPESTPDLRLYSANEFPLRDDAARSGFRFYLALPLFHLHNKDDNECCGVLELISPWVGMKGGVISSLYEGLQVVGLRSTHINFTTVLPRQNKMQADTEIRELLETVIQALPRLSLAQVWFYCKQCFNVCCMELAYYITASGMTVNSSSILKDGHMFYYIQACEFHHRQLDSNHFHQNLKDHSISKSPLEHYAPRARLSHRFAIHMQSVDNSNNPFVIEFFLQPERSSLHLLSGIIQMKLKSFKFEWGEQLLEIFQSSQQNVIECESIDMLKVMNSYKIEFSESNFKEYMDTVDDSCCLRPASTSGAVGWVNSFPSRERSCENHVNSSTILVPVLMKERIEVFMKKLMAKGRCYQIVQFWAPKMAEGRYYLETSGQPYAVGSLAKGLASFRKECIKHHYFVDNEAKQEELGPPGRVFRNKNPEVTPDLLLYSTKEFSMKYYAMHCGLRNYFVLPVFEKCKGNCVGVMEFIGFGYSKLADIGRALKEANLWSIDHIHFPPRFIAKLRSIDHIPSPRFIAHQPATIIDCRKKAFDEVSKAFSLIRKIPLFHMAKMWVPYEKCYYISSNSSCLELALIDHLEDDFGDMSTDEDHWIHVQPRKGMIGMALESESKSCFCRDLREFSIIDQPLALYDRKERADMCYAICLQSSLTGDLAYVLELFLIPSPQYVDSFFKFLLPVMKQELKSFTYACGKLIGEELVVDVIEFSEANNLVVSELGQLDDVPIKFRSVQYYQNEHQQAEEPVRNVSDGMPTEQCSVAASASRKRKKEKRNTLTLEDLEQHFGTKCDDVGKVFGGEISESTIRPAIKKAGIKRWPCTEKQARNLSLHEKYKEQDSQQDVQPSSIGNLQQIDMSLHQNEPRTNTESLVAQEDVETVITIKGPRKMKAHKAVVEERMVRSYELLPRPLKMLCSYAENELTEGTGIPVALDDEIFGDKCSIYVHLEDIIPFCDLDPISGNCIVVYIWKLYNKIKKKNMLARFQFVNPFTISCGENTESKRAHALAERLIVASRDQLVLVPCNVRGHWILTVIEPYKNVVSMLDPISHSNNHETWVHVVNIAMNFFNAYLKNYGVREPSWEVIKVPCQPDSKQCGYYVMRFMKEIVQGFNTIDSSSLSSLFVTKEYSQIDIDEVRIEWALGVIKNT